LWISSTTNLAERDLRHKLSCIFAFLQQPIWGRERGREMNSDAISSQIQSLSSSACLLAAIHSLLPNRKEEVLPQAAATI